MDDTIRYLGAVVGHYQSEGQVLAQILQLAEDGLTQHLGTMAELCATPEPVAEEIARGLHRLTNVVSALRQEELSRRLNGAERAAREGDAETSCKTWQKEEAEVQAILSEVVRLRTESAAPESD